MNANHPFTSMRARPRVQRDLCHLLALALLAGAILVPLPAAGEPQGPRPGATDPAVNYTEWRDDEIFAAKLAAQPADHTFSVYEADADLTSVTEKASANPEQHDALAAAAGRILTGTTESLVYAYRGSSPPGLALKFFDPALGSGYTGPVYTLPNLAARAAGSTDFFDIAAADINGTRAPDGEYRDEVAVAYAQPSGDNKLPVQLAVLDFTGASTSTPQPTGVLTITTAAKLDAADLSMTVGKIRPTDNLLAVATGDFDGNYLDEVAVAFLTGTRTAVVETYRYTTTVDAQNNVTPLLARATSTTINLGWGYYNGSIALAAADFDGNHRDELAVGTTGYWTDPDGIRVGDQRVYAAMVRFACNDGHFCTTAPAMTATLANNTQLFVEGGTETALRVQLGAGLFKYDPPNGWGINRQQLVVGHSQVGSLSVRTLAVNSDLTLAGLQSVSMWGEVPFWLAVGNFQGSASNTNPYATVALATWSGTAHSLYLIKPSTGTSTLVKQTTTAAAAAGARQPLVAMDWDGNSIYLGAPVQLTIENLVDTDAIIEEPPKHAYWDPGLKRVVTVSRYDAFTTILSMSTSDQLTSTSKDNSSTAWGNQFSASAYLGWETHGGALFTPKVDISLQTDLSAKVGKDYEDNESSYNSSYQSRTVDSTASTARDDYLKARLRLFDIWRYRVYGVTLDDPNGDNLFYDIILPGPYDSLAASGGGLTFPWYQPLHENGNILSYPGLASLSNPPDLGSYQIPCPSAAEAWDGAAPQCAKCDLDKDPACNLWGTKTLKMLWITPEQHSWDGAPETLTFKYSEESGSGAEHSYSEKMSSSQTVKATESVKLKWGTKVLGSSVSFGGSQQYDHHSNDSWGYSDSAQAKTTQSTGIQVQKPASDLTKPYAFYTTAYVTDDGTIHVAYAVDLSYTVSDRWWSEFYAPPDLSLNLPKHFYYISNVVTPHWQPRTGDDRKEARGLLFYKNEKDPVTGEYPLLNGAVVDGKPVRIEVRVYNYSLLNSVPAGTAVCFDTAPIDPATLKEIKAERKPIPNGCTALPYDLTPQASVLVSAVWDTTGYAGAAAGTSREYRVYAVLDPNNQVLEKYETEAKATQFYWTEDRQMNDGGYWTACAGLTDDEYAAKTCVDPAQNNEGYAYFTVSKQLPSDPRWGKPNHVSLAEFAIAPIDGKGRLVHDAVEGGSVQAYLGEPLQVRVAVQSTAINTDFAYAVLFDGDPKGGGTLASVDRVFVGNGEAGSYAWFEWTPTTVGPHRLFAKVLQSVDDPQPGGNTGTLQVQVVPLPPAGVRHYTTFLPAIRR